MPTTVRSFSKINLGLAIGPPRGDGFHGLTTLYQTLEAHDLVRVTAERLQAGGSSRIEITCTHPRVPVDARNTVWKMLERVLRGQAARWAVSVHIDKRLPVQGGLGAGSANAAAALLAFEVETGQVLGGGERLRLAAEVGSDVPLFLLGGAVLGSGRGEQVAPMPDLMPDLLPDLMPGSSGVEVVLALPGVAVSTPQAFRDWDAHLAAAASPSLQEETGILTYEEASGRLEELSRALASAWSEPHYSSGVFPAAARGGLARQPLSALVRTGIENDFESVVFRQHPSLGTIKRALLGLVEPGEILPADHAPLYAALSGSGSSLFGLYPDRASAAAAEVRLRVMGVRSLRTHMLGRKAYWETMFLPLV